MPANVTRLVVATPALRRAWFAATGLAIVVGLTASDTDQTRAGLLPFLILAPLVPVMGVALAYGLEADPAHEASLATPMSGLRLLLTRAAAVLAFSILVLGITALFTPGATLMAFGWLLPALGTTAITLAMMTIVAPRRAAVITGAAWVLLVLLSRAGANDPLAAFGIAGQLTMSTLAILGLLVAYVRRERFDLLGVLA
ncbi:MAG: hypothetical protein ACI8TP_002586 [Acidimicrobiales bacterium]|jgi:hypothetical protein